MLDTLNDIATIPELPRCHPAAELFALLDDDDLVKLAEDIAEHGLHQPIVFTEDGLLLDGRNRWRACHLADVEPSRTIYVGDEPTTHVMSLNIHRRHLTAGQRAMVAAEAMPMLKAEGRARMSAHARDGHDEQAADQGEQGLANLPNPEPTPHRSREEAAAVADVSPRTVGTANKVKDQAPDLAEKVRAGRMSLNAAAEKLNQRQAEARAVEDRDEQLAEVPSSASGERWWMYRGDFRDELRSLPGNTVDLIVTEPPEPAVFLNQAAELARIAQRVLTPSGVMVIAVDNTFLAKVVQEIAPYLAYGWTYMENGSERKINTRKIVSGWRPWLAFSNGTWPVDRLDWHPDTELAAGPAAQLIDGLCPANGTVLDPYTGTAAYGVTAIGSGRRFVGAEYDPDTFTRAVTNLEAAE